MRVDSEANHAAITAWIDGSLSPAQRQEFEAHLAGCADCQAQVSALLKARLTPKPDPVIDTEPARPAPGIPAGRLWTIAVCAVLVLAMGYALGLWAWNLAHH